MSQFGFVFLVYTSTNHGKRKILWWENVSGAISNWCYAIHKELSGRLLYRRSMLQKLERVAVLLRLWLTEPVIQANNMHITFMFRLKDGSLLIAYTRIHKMENRENRNIGQGYLLPQKKIIDKAVWEAEKQEQLFSMVLLIFWFLYWKKRMACKRLWNSIRKGLGVPELRAYRGGHRRPRDLPCLRPSPGLLWGSRGELLSTCKGFHFSKVSLKKRKLFLPWKPCKYSNMSAVQGAVLLCRQRRYVGQYFMQRTVLKKYIRLKMG